MCETVSIMQCAPTIRFSINPMIMEIRQLHPATPRRSLRKMKEKKRTSSFFAFNYAHKSLRLLFIGKRKSKLVPPNQHAEPVKPSQSCCVHPLLGFRLKPVIVEIYRVESGHTGWKSNSLLPLTRSLRNRVGAKSTPGDMYVELQYEHLLGLNFWLIDWVHWHCFLLRRGFCVSVRAFW